MKYQTTSLNISSSVNDQFFTNIQAIYADNVNRACNLETVLYSDISSYDFKAMNIAVRAKIDFIDVCFEVEKETNRHLIKKYLTEKTDIKHFIVESKNSYIIRLHDINSWLILKERLSPLMHYGCKLDEMYITQLEICLDFYGYRHLGLLIALLKSLRLPSKADNLRIFKNQKGVFHPLPCSVLSLYQKLSNGYNIGINHKNASEYWHLYLKTTDHNKKPLPSQEWRIRAEKNLKHDVLLKMDNSLLNIKQVLLSSFQGLKFTKLKRGLDPKIRKNLYKEVKLLGIEKTPYFDHSRNRRVLNPLVDTNKELNQIVATATHNLCKNFLPKPS